MVLSHSRQTAIALTFGLALVAGTLPALARGGTSHGASPMHSGSGTTGMPGPGRGSPPGSGSSGSSSGHGGTSTSASGGAVNSGLAPFTPLTPSTGPSDNLPPMQELPQIAPPLPQLPEQFATGGSSGVNTLALSPGSTGSPSSPGGGGKDLASCMGFWDRATHMSKPEWRATCLRTMQEYPSL